MKPLIEADLPFDANQNEVFITQGFNGPYSHNLFQFRSCKYDLRYALDFALPYGTTVQAVRQGIVRYVFFGNGYYEGGDPELGRTSKAASVIVAHPDIEGFSTAVNSFYQHLDPEQFLVEPGQMVERGQPIGKTGKTGWVGENPHLHLHFQRRVTEYPGGPVVASFPFTLNGYNGPVEDAEIIQGLVGDSRELAKKILAIRKRDGLF